MTLDAEDVMVITPIQLAQGWMLYYRGVNIRRRYRIVRKMEDNNYLVLVPNPRGEVDTDGTVKFDMANVKI